MIVPQRSYASFLSPTTIAQPLSIPPPVWKDYKLTLCIPQQMVSTSKDSFSFTAIGKFVGRRPSLERLEQWVYSSWRIARPSFISLTERGHFLFRFSTKEERDSPINQRPLHMDRKKLLLLPWSPGQDEDVWPAVTPVWIRLKGIPYHCWSSDILLSVAASIGKPLRLDETTASQRLLSYARVLVNFDLAKTNPCSLTVDLEGEAVVEVEVYYENTPVLYVFLQVTPFLNALFQ
eukprot:TRINITY_DN38603_c4_g1_i1.p1 TRINITY_DN38603_c4_g1~~TRINITY_DN38603_c4_g1_i1.p1  ORF type:complete len:234 (-),score=26.72 TRINITY_DN38603_c4_g1_i1:171-872(-)